jgi:hypothetical protein
MSDPVSIAGSAVGISSLGLHICQSLMSYLSTIEGREDEITNSLREVETLIPIFNALHEILPQVDTIWLVKSPVVRQCLSETETKLLELQEMLVKLRGPSVSAGVKGKFEGAARSLIYPFREAKLLSLRGTLRSLLDNLSMAIDITSLYASSEPLLDFLSLTSVLQKNFGHAD